ncbi:MAG: pyridoxal phosphate-dependent aminotransferase [Lachnospiraceae bacterium]|nr:pyridoxal phosphate-dependent aminotransferase [Lachnospiraceae bacterium]MBQ8878451.1 pyridoxal phosphate-dependent aminotransferase [Lachnospiraceae bacterium]
MAEKNLDFDAIVDRKNTYSLKYDFAKERNMPEDLLPLWVADMDFKVSSYIQEALQKQVEHGIFGYSEVKEDYFKALKRWMKSHHGWDVESDWLVKTPGVVFALAMAVKAFTKEGDGVLLQQPVYYPFSEVIVDNGRKLVSNTLVQDETGKYVIDYEDFENKIVKENIKLFFLCNPHNPVGRVWRGEELIRLGDICYKHRVIVVSDEIHADFVFQGKHQVFVDLKEAYKEIAIVATSPSKTFNIAGLQVSNIFIPNAELRKKIKKQIDAAGYSQLNVLGLVAAQAAYEYGEEWYQAMHRYVSENIAYTRQFVQDKLPGVTLVENEGTYLLWLDFRTLQLSDRELEDLIVKQAKLWLDSGRIFGTAGKGFQRINVACPRETLKEALTRLEAALNEA